MPESTPPETPLFGYLTVVDDPVHGACGGYLIVNSLGRPVEFHCTAPVQPSRAQQILYGPTLRASLYGEQIALALVEKATAIAAVVLVDQPECLELQHHTELRVVLINPVCEPGTADSSSANANQRMLFPDLLPNGSTQCASADVRPLLQLLGESIDVSEPFDRIREAIFEAQQIGGAGQGGDARAA
jgi:hypothetical protein